ncbi:MAG: di-heme oxidoredictase family protein [Chthoniobacterales bacterium]
MKTPVTRCILSGALILVAAAFVAPTQAKLPLRKTKAERFLSTSGPLPEGPAKWFYIDGVTNPVSDSPSSTPAQTGYDNLTNGFAIQGPAFDTINKDNVIPTRSFNDGRFVFEQTEAQALGLGPIYNGQSCGACHQNVATGGASQITVQRTGHTEGDMFFESLGGSLIQSRATYDDIVEHVADTDETRAFRISPAALGDGYVECISDSTLTALRDAQPIAVRGTAISVPVLEGNGSARVGRFGWKAQHASLVSFAADAYANEMGVTSPLFPDENTSSGTFVGYGTEYDPLPDPEDDGDDVEGFALFMRSTKAPTRGTITTDVRNGEKRFNQIGCGTCHVGSITTASAGTVINGGSFVIPTALGDKIIRPFSDFLLHDIGTGDGIPIQPLPEFAGTAKQMKTAPLWGLRTRNRLMHDGLSFTLTDAIQRHAGQAASSVTGYNALSATDKARVLAFLQSL